MVHTPTPHIFYDGLCRQCRSFAAYLQRQQTPGAMTLIDIRQAGFNPGQFGKSREEFEKQLQVRTASGTWLGGFSGVSYALTYTGHWWWRLLFTTPLLKQLCWLFYRLAYWQRGWQIRHRTRCAHCR